MEKKLTYYLYLLLGAGIIGHAFLLFKLEGVLLAAESTLFMIILLMSAFIAYSFEMYDEKPYIETMLFFAILTFNSIIIYIMTSKFDAAFLGLLNVLGIYLTSLIIPDIRRKSLNKKTKTQNTGLPKPIFPPAKPNYFADKLKRELAKKAEKSREEIKKEFYKKDIGAQENTFAQEKKLYEDSEKNIPDTSDESEIFIEEIKPALEKDIRPLKSIKKHLGGRARQKSYDISGENDIDEILKQARMLEDAEKKLKSEEEKKESDETKRTKDLRNETWMNEMLKQAKALEDAEKSLNSGKKQAKSKQEKKSALKKDLNEIKQILKDAAMLENAEKTLKKAIKNKKRKKKR